MDVIFCKATAFPINSLLNTTVVPLPVKYEKKKAHVGQENLKNFRIRNNIWRKH